MRRNFWALLALATLFVSATWQLLAFEGELTVEQLSEKRKQAQQLVKDGNWKEALEIYEATVVAGVATPDQVVTDLRAAVNCQNRLRKQSSFDELINRALEQHGGSWEVLAAASQLLNQATHYGGIEDGKFIRGRSNNRWITVAEQDRRRSLQMMVKAVEEAGGFKPDADLAEDQQRIYLQLAQSLLNGRSGQQSWRLWKKTDLQSQPVYNDMDQQQSWPSRYAPVDEEGNPRFLSLPESWQAARSDGERLRWAFAKAIASNGTKDQAASDWASFLSSQFSVSTLAQYSWIRQTSSDDNTHSIAAVHTLEDDQTIARLAKGPKRFSLPEDFNYIAIWKRIAQDRDSGLRRMAYQQLASVYMNRRQYNKAEAVLLEQIEQLGEDRYTKQQLNRIQKPQANFDAIPTQLAGKAPKLGFVYRNAAAVDLTARQVDVKGLIESTKQYYRSLQTNPANRQRNGSYNLRDLRQIFKNQNVVKHLVGQEFRWTQELKSRDDHWDQRIDLSAPVRESGLYLIDAKINGKTAARCLLWLQNTAIVRVPSDGRVEYHVLDAESGKPVLTRVKIFGYRNVQVNNKPRQYKMEIVERTLTTDVQGVVRVPSDLVNNSYNFLVTADSGESRLAFLSWERLRANSYQSSFYSRFLAYGVSDRPLYRPGENIKVNFWLGNPIYGKLFKANSFQGKQVRVELYDSKNTKVASQTLEADKFNRVSAEFPLEKTCGLGNYYFRVYDATGRRSLSSSLSVRVEEYRKPEFEVEIEAPEGGIQLGATIKARVSAKYYFGSPVTDADVTVRVERTAYSDNFYPYDPFDWCYGPGYWWYAYNCEWYPGYDLWRGCAMPRPMWWGGSYTPPELVLEDAITLDENGEAVVEIDTALAKELYGDEDHKYAISVEVRDSSRRTITATGSVIAAREPFKIYSWTNRGYYRVGEKITANFQARTLTGTPIVAAGKLDLLKVTYDAERKPIERVVQSWDATTDTDGSFTQEINAGQSGQFRLRLRLKEGSGQEVEGGYLFTVRGDQDDPRDFRFSDLELIPQKRTYSPSETLELQINANRSDARVHLFVRVNNGTYPKQMVVRLKNKTAVVKIPVKREDQPNFFIEAYSVFDGKLHKQVKEIVVPPQERVLDVQVTSDEENYKPGQQAEVKVKVRDLSGKPVQTSLVVAAYDRSLEQIASREIPQDIRAYFWKWRRSHYPRLLDNLGWYNYPVRIDGLEGLQPLGIFGRGVADMTRGQLGVMEAEGMAMDEAADAFAPAPAAAAGGGAGFGGGGMARQSQANFASKALAIQTGPKPNVRSDFSDTALWLADVVTNDKGEAIARFKMPESLASWRIKTWGVSQGLKVGSATSKAVTRKDLMIRLQKPRFLVERDEVIISAIVNNDLPNEEQVRVSLEIDGETSMQILDASQATQTVTVASLSQKRVDWLCKATAEGRVTLRVKAIGRTESDAMQDSMPIVVNGTLKTESWAGTVRSGEEASSISMQVPKARRPEQSKLVVRVSPSLAAAMIDALPYLVDYPYGCTEQTLNRFLPTVITQNTLQRMQIDLQQVQRQRNNLNAQQLPENAPAGWAEKWRKQNRNPVFDVSKVNDMVKVGVTKLRDMQNPDGGWGWFSGSGARSFPHTTAVVVRGLIIAKENGAEVPPNVISRGMQWLTNYQQTQLQRLRNRETKTDPYKNYADQTDALVLSVLALGGQINEEMQNALYADRLRLPQYCKVLLALVTHQAGNQQQTEMLRRNIEQFLVEDQENETAYLDSGDSWWYWYGDGIETNAMYLKLLSKLEPKGVTAPRVVKYLLNNRGNAVYWKSTRDTALVVEAFADYLQATDEIAQDATVVVSIDGQRLGEIRFTKESLFSVDNTLVVIGNALKTGEHELEIRREGEGNLYWNAYLTNFTQEEEIEKAGLEVKIERRFWKLTPEQKQLDLPSSVGSPVDTQKAGFKRERIEDLEKVASGTLVEVELLLESKNNYEYLLVKDLKPACLEAVDTQSGYFYGNNLWVYRELRDQYVGFFIQNLPRGKHVLTYQLRVEAPGKFTALPALIEGMYAPELVGNSRDFDFQAVDQ